MKVAISGANGFVGKNLTLFLKGFGYEIVAIGRSDFKLNVDEFMQKLNGVEIIINLAGAPIIKRWTKSYKKEIYSSRIDTTKKIVDAIKKMEIKPKLFISTSAVGIYDNKRVHSEDDFGYANDFLSKVCQEWEGEALKAKDDTKVAIFRFGIVLGYGGGALAKMLPSFKLGIAGTIGDGSQGFSFIHIRDLERAFKFVIDKKLDGIFNLSAPEPTTNKGLTKTLGKALHRPTILPLPPFILHLVYGDGGKVLTDGQQMIPKKLLNSGFEFEFKDINEAINDIVSKL